MASNNARGQADNCGWRKRRKQYVVNAAFQWKCCVTIAVVIFFASSMISCVLYGILHQQARMRLIHPATYTAEVPWVIFAFGVGFAALTAGGVGLWSIFMTHRICGPLSLLRRHVEDLSEGRLPKVRPLRRKDEFKDLFVAFGRAVSSLNACKRAELSTLTKVLDIAHSAVEGDDGQRKEALVAVASHIEPLRNMVEAAFDEHVSPSAPSELDGAEAMANEPIAVG